MIVPGLLAAHGMLLPVAPTAIFRYEHSELKDYYSARGLYLEFPQRGRLHRHVAKETRKQVSDKLKDWVAFFSEATLHPDPDDFVQEDGKPYSPFTFDAKTILSVSLPDFVSVYVERTEYAGGHVLEDPFCANYVLQDGKPAELAIADVFRPAELPELRRRVTNRISECKAMRGHDPFFGIDEVDLDTWVVTPAGIAWVFVPYEVGAGFEGGYVAKLTWEELGGLVRGDSAVASFRDRWTGYRPKPEDQPKMRDAALSHNPREPEPLAPPLWTEAHTGMPILNIYIGLADWTEYIGPGPYFYHIALPLERPPPPWETTSSD